MPPVAKSNHYSGDLWPVESTWMLSGIKPVSHSGVSVCVKGHLWIIWNMQCSFKSSAGNNLRGMKPCSIGFNLYGADIKFYPLVSI